MKKKSDTKQNVTLEDSDLFDDCAICQAMKEAKSLGKTLSENELISAFKKAKQAGAIVGGPLMEKLNAEQKRLLKIPSCKRPK